MLEQLEARETPNSLYNPLFGTAFLSLDQLDVPYTIAPADGSISGSLVRPRRRRHDWRPGSTQNGSTGGTVATNALG